MKTFAEFSEKNKTSKPQGFPTFTDIREGEGPTAKCMSESMMERLRETYESMCEEMKTCHEDESDNTAETYLKECNEKLTEMMENMTKTCESYLSAMN